MSENEEIRQRVIQEAAQAVAVETADRLADGMESLIPDDAVLTKAEVIRLVRAFANGMRSEGA